MAASSIKPKVGQCLDCPDGTLRPLTAGRCQTHYWPYRASQKKNSPGNIKKAADLKTMGVFMASQLPLIPQYCENDCGTRLTKSGPGGYKTHIAHILPKAYYTSVKTHPSNRWFGCGDCHTDWDKKGAERQPEQPVAALVVERFKEFMEELTRKEVGRMQKEFPWLYAIYMEARP